MIAWVSHLRRWASSYTVHPALTHWANFWRTLQKTAGKRGVALHYGNRSEDRPLHGIGRTASGDLEADPKTHTQMRRMGHPATAGYLLKWYAVQVNPEIRRKAGPPAKMMSACGVLCSDCPAYHGDAKGVAHQKRTVAAWARIYKLNESIENIRCGGCLGPDEELFHTSRTCKARQCCGSKGFGTCAECSVEGCPDLEKAQLVWDQVPHLAKDLPRKDFVTYVQPYCDHRRRLAEARRALSRRPG